MTAAGRILSAFKALARRASDPVLHGLYEYRVVIAHDGGDFLDLQATVPELPDLARVASRPGLGGSRTSPALGSLVLVGFINGSPARPTVLAYAGHDGEGWSPTTATLDGDSVELGGALGPVMRYGDKVTITPGNAAGVVNGVASFDPTPPGFPVVSRVKA